MNAPLRTRIKFCGMTRAQDVALAGELGVDAVGFVFASKSPRRLDIEQAAALRAHAMPFVDVVALMMDSPAELVREVVARVRPTLLQFHGDEDDAYCRGFGLPFLKAVAMGGTDDEPVAARFAHHPHASGFLLDSHARGGSGGTGRTFDWSRVPHGIDRPLLLAGGIGPDNVFDAIRAVQPWGVDVSSGIESAPGEKDAVKMRRFVEEVRRADAAAD
ncbi:phosphoribosylanthranilate isomerase [Lysobacter sp. LF1]|uniref:N-(5'-phosphoribosyl)anthranilate isomerase n=1 Tax=Lysobacter stagni TaxID=3045172 RepID=A0ABT6XJG7_9GAMM|nr:phosphoribosylanthranilate isomerase [Lysobacter sp. LF1]MDI9240307.1 phosphoribosylanthranilate isomerase [Lysobacter sp. LF1]